jgi:orotidine-5'-phosphate decarboxylase
MPLEQHYDDYEAPAARDRLIVALDVGSVDEALTIIGQLGDAVAFYKVGWHLILDPDLHTLLQHLKARDKNIFLDCKAFDIPATVEGAVRAAANLGMKFITVAGQRQIMQAAVRARGNSPLQILVVTLLTYMNKADLESEYGYGGPLNDFIIARAQFAANEGCNGVISSAKEVRLIRDRVGKGLVIVTPGIRPRGASVDDQKRVTTPYEAIMNGSDYLVVGRPIIHADNKREAAARILGEMQSGLNELPPSSETPRRRAYA